MHNDHDHGEIHLPPPSIRPITMALGATLLAAGIVTSVWVVLLGLAIFIFGLGGWMWDDIQHDKAELAKKEQH